MGERRIIQPGDGDRSHGTAYGYGPLRCGKQPDGSRQACDACREAHQTYQREYYIANKHRKRIIQPGDGDPKHGTLYGYNTLRCGKQSDRPRQACDACAEASRQYMRSRYRRAIQPGDGDPRHGTVNGYCNLRCGWRPDGPRQSCTACRQAWADRHLKYMQNTPAQMERHRRYEQAKRDRKRQIYGVPYEQVPRS
jgi:hypothetical protein